MCIKMRTIYTGGNSKKSVNCESKNKRIVLMSVWDIIIYKSTNNE